MSSDEKPKSRYFTIFALGLCVLLAYFSYYGVLFLYYKHNGEVLAANTTRYEQSGDDLHFAVLGDSLAFGVGASNSASSFAGQLGSKYPRATVENRSVIGAATFEMRQQILDLKIETYDAIFLFIGGNDVMRYVIDLDRSSADVATTITRLSERAKKVYVFPIVDFTNVNALPWFAKGYYRQRSLVFNNAMMSTASNLANVIIVDLSKIDGSQYKTMQAKDGFHLNDSGYKRLFNSTPL